ncbi:hypothetical protein IM753_10075 [Moraxella sp. K127]|uniref:Antitoxin YefM n=1 Tax=Moraxella lacunata TaxID=477 RepID=A0A1V4H3U7_MORLA|nr:MULTISPECIES: hypothetical protein [Moraxella]MBE9591312.1 hypothetical protein [Moraxella sp. K127]OPH39537.1 hypothetical protein B5J94_00040 [Moraxella lacunata]STY99395.1 Antitoxin YefM [Moraxella lacunata]
MSKISLSNNQALTNHQPDCDNVSKTPCDETEYLLSSPANAKRLLKAIDDVKHGRAIQRELIDN